MHFKDDLMVSNYNQNTFPLVVLHSKKHEMFVLDQEEINSTKSKLKNKSKDKDMFSCSRRSVSSKSSRSSFVDVVCVCENVGRVHICQSEVVYMTAMTSETLLESLLPADLPLSMSDFFQRREHLKTILVKNIDLITLLYLSKLYPRNLIKTTG